MSKQFKTALLLTLGIAIGVSASITGSVFALKDSSNNGLPLNELRNLSDIFSRIKSDYVEDVQDKVILSNYIQGILAGLHPPPTYLNPRS